MDFLNSYFPITPIHGNSNSPFDEERRSTNNVYDDAEHLAKVQDGDYSELREVRKNLDKKHSRVQFIAPISEEGESLKSVVLTPKPKFCEGSHDDDISSDVSRSTQERKATVRKSKNVRILGIKLGRRNSAAKDIN